MCRIERGEAGEDQGAGFGLHRPAVHAPFALKQAGALELEIDVGHDPRRVLGDEDVRRPVRPAKEDVAEGERRERPRRGRHREGERGQARGPAAHSSVAQTAGPDLSCRRGSPSARRWPRRSRSPKSHRRVYVTNEEHRKQNPFHLNLNPFALTPQLSSNDGDGIISLEVDLGISRPAQLGVLSKMFFFFLSLLHWGLLPGAVAARPGLGPREPPNIVFLRVFFLFH